ncbi:hypothetical protein ACLOJK_011955 [Asimina triloba]
MYISGGAVESVNFSGGSSNCQLNIRGRGPGHFGAYSSRRPTSCTVISREAEFNFVDREFLLTNWYILQENERLRKIAQRLNHENQTLMSELKQKLSKSGANPNLNGATSPNANPPKPK